MAKFNITKGANSDEKTLGDKAALLENKKDFDLRHIQVDKIIPNPENFYELTNIEDLAESIKEFGVMQNLEVVEVEEDGEKMYRLITGHRRLEAVKLLISQGKEIKTIPCTVERNLTKDEEKLRLIKSNSDTRELTQEEKRRQVEMLNVIYKVKAEKKGEKINKKELKEIVANNTGISAKQVERYNTINENLIPQLQDYFDSEKISFSEAIKFARLDEQMQLAILDLFKRKDKVTDEELNIIKKENKKLIEDNKVKDKKLEEKESFINILENEKLELENEKETNVLEQGVIDEEKKQLELKIREEMAQLTEEELNKHKEKLEEVEKKAKELEKIEKELSQKLVDKEIELNDKVKELEENKIGKVDEKTNNSTITTEALEKAIAQEKFKEVKKTIITNIITLGELIKKTKCETLEEAEETFKDIERALQVYKNKINKLIK